MKPEREERAEVKRREEKRREEKRREGQQSRRGDVIWMK